MIDFFKNKAQKKAIQTIRQKLERHMSFSNFKAIKIAGIIIPYQFDVENTAITKLLESLKSKDIEAKILIYFPEKKIPVNVVPKDNMIFISKGNTNWFDKPKQIDSFINSEFGLLIDLSTQYNFTLQYIIEASKASFKVGRFSYDDNPYDFVLVGDNVDDNKYIDDLFNYLSKVQ